MSIRKSWGLGIPFGNCLTKLPGYCKSCDPPQIELTTCQFLLFLKFRSIWCVVESAVLVGMVELSFCRGNCNVNGRFPIPWSPGILICPIPIRFWVLPSVGDPMSSRNSWIVWVCLSFGISMIECSGFRKLSYSSQSVYRFPIFSSECFFTGCYRFRLVSS